MTDAEVKEEFAALESALAGGAPHWQLEVPEGGIIGVESILFIGPSYDVTEESLLAINAWGLRTKDDGTVVAVHPYKTYWDYRIAHDDVVIDPSVLEMDLPTFRTRLTAAHQARLSAEGGLRSLPEYPPLMTDANRLRQFLVEAGALDNPGFPLKAIPPACGLAVPNQTDNPGLMRDCMALLAAKDTLRGTATLDWSTGDSIGDWEGISTGGTPTRVIKLELPNDNLSGSIPAGLGDLAELTHLDLSSNSLTGDIPSELGGLSDLESIKLSGNSLTGCIPPALKDVTTNDLSSLDLFYCAPSPENLTAAATGDTSMVLSWDAVSNTSKYRVEYIRPRDDDWTVDNDTIATTTHTVEGLTCDSPYYFRVSAYGDGVTYAAAWSVPSVVLTETTGTCVPPVFGASSYSFTIPDDTAIGESVGTVSATHPDGDTVSYSITSGNEDGKFGIDDSTGAITVSGTLDYSTTKSYTLIVKAGVERRGAVSIAVSISVLQTCSSGIAVADPDNNPGMVSDCKILLGARDALAGTATLDWSVNTSIGDWEGITTGDTPSRVTGLNLESQGLTGSIPPELAQLTNLEELLLSFNRLTGDIPAELGGLTNLTKLHLRYNDLTGEIPPELGNLSNLTELWLHSNQLTGPIPPELGSLSDLVWLGVSYNLLTGPIPPELGGLTELEWLWLHNNQLTGTIPWQLGTLSNLTTLEIAGNQLEGCIPSALRRVRTNDLHRLGLSNCTEVGAVPAPGGVSASLAEGTFTITWSPVSGAGRYEVQYVIRGSGEDWAGVETTTVTSLTYSPEGGPVCGSTHQFRVRAYGDAVTYAAGWGSPSGTDSVDTEACNQAPEFDNAPYDFSVSEVASTGDIVGTVSATDPDTGDTVSYLIAMGNAEGRFSINDGTGTITVAGPLDYETTPSYTLMVEADDGRGGMATSTVNISVTDVPEDLPPAPEGVSASLADGTFSIAWNAVTGAAKYEVQYVVRGSGEDWAGVETTTATTSTYSPEGGSLCGSTYEFRIRAYGDGVAYVAEWGAESEHAPVDTESCNRDPEFDPDSYTFLVSEDASTGDSVGSVSATDLDTGDTVSYAITVGTGDSVFDIDGSTGEITVAGALDHETTPSYTLMVEASDDRGGTATAEVAITVTDVAEDPPLAPENLAATLADGTFSLTWDMVAGAAKYEVQWRIGAADAQWTALPETDSSSANYAPEGGPDCSTEYQFRVRAYGDGETYAEVWGAESDTDTVTTPTCPPVFGQASYSFFIRDTAAADSAVGRVSATDPDTGDSVSYAITAGNDDGKFAINSSTGRLSVAGEEAFNLAVNPAYSLTVEASDGQGGTATARVKVALTIAACANGTVVPQPRQNQRLVRDCSVLLTAKDTLRGTTTLNWSADTPITQWEGVRRRGTSPQYVGTLYLPAMGLDGSIPAVLSGLGDLRRLDLDDNDLTGSIPAELGKLEDLEQIYLFNNRLTGSIPAEFGNLRSLQILSLYGNDLTGSIPTELGKLHQLRELVLDGNDLTGELPTELGNLTRLEYLYARDNQLTGTIPRELTGLANLTYLLLEGNSFTGCIPSGLQSVENNDLDLLDIDYCVSPES